MSEDIGQEVNEMARAWGLSCAHFEIRDINPPENLVVNEYTVGDALGGIDEMALVEAEYSTDECDSEEQLPESPSRREETVLMGMIQEQAKAEAISNTMQNTVDPMDVSGRDREVKVGPTKRNLAEHADNARKGNAAYNQNGTGTEGVIMRNSSGVAPPLPSTATYLPYYYYYDPYLAAWYQYLYRAMYPFAQPTLNQRTPNLQTQVPPPSGAGNPPGHSYVQSEQHQQFSRSARSKKSRKSKSTAPDQISALPKI